MLINHVFNGKSAKALVDLISSDQYQVGDYLPPERELAKMFGISRSSLRESLQGLKDMGILQSRQGSGICIIDKPNFSDNRSLLIGLQRERICELLEIREALDMKALSLIPLSEFPALADKLELSLIAAKRDLHSSSNFRAHDIEFHGLIREACGNKLLLSICHDISNATYDERNELFESPEPVNASLIEHTRIYEAIRRLDRKGAEDAFLAHVARVKAYINRA